MLDDPRALPQGDCSARPALAGGKVGRHGELMVFYSGEMLDDVFAIGIPAVDPEGEMRPGARLGLPVLFFQVLARKSKVTTNSLKRPKLAAVILRHDARCVDQICALAVRALVGHRLVSRAALQGRRPMSTIAAAAQTADRIDYWIRRHVIHYCYGTH